MSEMVKRVALALYRFNHPRDALMPRHHEGVELEDYYGDARAAIAAMREPTPAMRSAAFNSEPDDEGFHLFGREWEAAIDEALK